MASTAAAAAAETPSRSRNSNRTKPHGGTRGRKGQGGTVSLGATYADFNRSATTVVTEEDETDLQRRRFRDIDERRHKEWSNYQMAQQESEDQQASNVVFIDLNIGDGTVQRLTIEVFDDTPITAANFRKLLLGETGFDGPSGLKLDYVDSVCDRLIPGFGVYLGELAIGVSLSAEGGTFADENFAHRHTGRGSLSMAVRGPHTNGSAFFIAFDRLPQLDFQQVVFGRVIEGLAVLDALEAAPTTRNGVPKAPIVITFCGALSGKAPGRSWPDDPEEELNGGTPKAAGHTGDSGGAVRAVGATKLSEPTNDLRSRDERSVTPSEPADQEEEVHGEALRQNECTPPPAEPAESVQVIDEDPPSPDVDPPPTDESASGDLPELRADSRSESSAANNEDLSPPPATT